MKLEDSLTGRGPLRAVLFDLDGVLYNAEEPIAGAAETLAWIQARGIPHLFVTNTTSRSAGVIAEKLARFGITARESDILTPCDAAAEWLRARDDGDVALFLRPAARGPFEGIACLSDDAERGARHVVIGDLGSAWDFRTLNRAFRLLHSNPEATLIALGMTRYWKAPDGISMDVAPFVAALEHATGRKALVLGKPSEPFFRAAVERLNVPAAEILMVGDDIDSDIAGAQRAGLKAALVRTGKFRQADLETGVTPDVVLDSIAVLPDWWERPLA